MSEGEQVSFESALHLLHLMYFGFAQHISHIYVTCAYTMVILQAAREYLTNRKKGADLNPVEDNDEGPLVQRIFFC